MLLVIFGGSGLLFKHFSVVSSKAAGTFSVATQAENNLSLNERTLELDFLDLILLCSCAGCF